MKVLLETKFPTLKFLKRGKVRDIYDVGDHLLFVATDRLSAFDVVMPQGIPNKGKVLTQISAFWFEQTKQIIRNHVVSTNVDEFPSECTPYREDLRGRSMLVKKTNPLSVECIVRGYISGSGWQDYKSTGSICGIKLPAGLVESQKLPETIFTPSTKAEIGIHDENISFDEMVKREGKEIAEQVRSKAIAIFEKAAEIAESKGIIIADTKMEFGLSNGSLVLIDELLTPDSSRFWPKETYQPGKAQNSYDKQFVRDYLVSINFNKKPPGPMMPEEVISKTSELYKKALSQLTGKHVE
ncbi:MAG: phosphoribosylaminoimidazolesuccinocarboxamide synthase [Ignavibacteriales bacterium]|nr:phosphoribosylaminoimidazolesuccinocarboxamide synthase [Ignavibacteriales bacterium]